MDTLSTADRAPVKLTITPLGASVTAYYPSASGEDRLASVGLWAYVRAQGWSDEAGTLTLEDSDDRTTWATVGSALTFTADVINTFDWTALTKRYWRWKYVNDGTAQTIFRLLEDKAPDLNAVPAAATNLITLQNAAAATANGAAINTVGYGTVAIQVSGTFSATISFECTVDGTNWTLLPGEINTGTRVTSTSATGIFLFNVGGRAQFRARISAYTSGSVTVKGYATALGAGRDYVTVIGTVTSSGTVTGTVTGNVAHDAADSGNPVKIGGTATAALPTAVTEGDRANASFTLDGNQRINVASSTLTSNPSATQTRPNNATPYTALDVVGQDPAVNMTFTTTLRAANGFVIYGASLEIDVAAIPTGMAGFRLHLYDAAPTAIADNAAYDLPSGDRAKYIGYLTFLTPVDLVSTLWAKDDGERLGGRLATGSVALYGILETLGGYTPTASAVKNVRLLIAGV